MHWASARIATSTYLNLRPQSKMQNRSPRRWLPVHAKKGRRLKRLSNPDFTDTLKSLNLKYGMVIAGSCYSRILKRSPTVGLSNANNLHIAFRASARGSLWYPEAWNRLRTMVET